MLEEQARPVLSDTELATSHGPAAAGEYTARRSKKHSTTSHKAKSISGLRRFYFGLASLWGFLSGAVTLSVAFAVSGRSVPGLPLTLAALSVGAVLAVVGGVIAAGAYREARRRVGR